MTYLMRDINGMIREALERRGLTGQFHYIDDQGGRMVWEINGEQLTPGQAADRYLIGGFAGNFGRQS